MMTCMAIHIAMLQFYNMYCNAMYSNTFFSTSFLYLFISLSFSLSAAQTADYRAKKKRCRRLRHKLFHIKRMVKDYDKNHS